MNQIWQQTFQWLRPGAKHLPQLLQAFALCFLWTACAAQNTGTNTNTNSSGSPDELRVGDKITIILSDVPPPGPYIQDQTITEDGYITLHLDKRFLAAGKSKTQLQKEIREAYVPGLYVRMTVTVKPEERFIFLSGEVRAPNRYIYSGETTVLKAIATAGGFAPFARESKVEITRMNGKKEKVDCVEATKNSKLDLPVYPGDRIFVPKSPFGRK